MLSHIHLIHFNFVGFFLAFYLLCLCLSINQNAIRSIFLCFDLHYHFTRFRLLLALCNARHRQCHKRKSIRKRIRWEWAKTERRWYCLIYMEAIITKREPNTFFGAEGKSSHANEWECVAFDVLRYNLNDVFDCISNDLVRCAWQTRKLKLIAIELSMNECDFRFLFAFTFTTFETRT